MIEIAEDSTKPLGEEKQELELIDIIKNQIYIISSMQEWNSLNICNKAKYLYPFFYKKLVILKTNYDKLKLGNTIKIFESYRSPARQQKVYNDGASKIKSLGMHYFCVAVDIVFFKNNIISWKGDYNKLWELGKKLLMQPVSTSDLCHFQYIRVDEQKPIRTIYKRIITVFQQLSELIPDGVLGPKTHTKLIQNLPYFEENWKKIISLI